MTPAASRHDIIDMTYPLRAAARLTGLSPAVLRAWERRYGVVEPLRTPGGARRYRASDLERLRLVKAAVDAGHRIGRIASLDARELEELGGGEAPAAGDRIAEIIGAAERLDGSEAQRLLSLQLSALGPVRFAREFALPLVREIGELWSQGRLEIASEHLATAILRSLLGSALQSTAASARGPRVLVATPSGEAHEIGSLVAALTALGAGADVVFLGADVPAEDLIRAVERSRAAALALGIVTLSAARASQTLRAVRGGIAADVPVWIGGAGALALDEIPGVERIESLESLEQRVALLVFQKPQRG